jgi:hypothetical protein
LARLSRERTTPTGQRTRTKKYFAEPNPFASAKRLVAATLKTWSKTMQRRLIRYQAKPEMADKNAELVAAVFAELKDAKPDGIRYLTLRLEDNTFVHLVETTTDAGSSALTQLRAFQAFQSGIRDRCAEPPLVLGATVVGNYRMLGEA